MRVLMRVSSVYLPAPRLEGVRVEMSRVYRDMESGRRDSQDGSRLVYVLTQIAKVLELTEIERRLVTLEIQAKKGQT